MTTTLLMPPSQVSVLRRRFGSLSSHRRPCPTTIRSSLLPFSPEKAKFHRELSAAVDVVERACRLCVDVKRSLFSDDGRILQKNDQTPVTIADFAVQALISLELKRLFPSIPLVAEEDSAYLRSRYKNSQKTDSKGGTFLVDSIFSVVVDKANRCSDPLTAEVLLAAIDRGGKNSFSFSAKPATYWVLDPIDGTRGFLMDNNALYVVGLALVVEGEIVLGIMGCPNWKGGVLSDGDSGGQNKALEAGIIMISHKGCGTWTRESFYTMADSLGLQGGWQRCYVDSCSLVHKARFSTPESQSWDLMPLSVLYNSTFDRTEIRDEKKILLVAKCCGSLCKYLMVACGQISVYIQRTKPQRAIKVWDHAAGVVCVHEAGGQVTDWNGTQLDLAADEAERRIISISGGVLVTNGKLHNQIVELISSNSSVI